MSGGQIMVIMIILIVSIASIFKARYQALNRDSGPRSARKSRGRQVSGGSYDQLSDDEHTPRELELESEVIALRKRLEVLERITTDANSSDRLRSKQVADEIESLRDR